MLTAIFFLKDNSICLVILGKWCNFVAFFVVVVYRWHQAPIAHFCTIGVLAF